MVNSRLNNRHSSKIIEFIIAQRGPNGQPRLKTALGKVHVLEFQKLANIRMIDGKKVALIDVGGSAVKAYICHEKISSQLVMNKKWKTGSDKFEKKIIEGTIKVKKEFGCNEAIIGIPGPVDNSRNYTFCPPLDTKFHSKY